MNGVLRKAVATVALTGGLTTGLLSAGMTSAHALAVQSDPAPSTTVCYWGGKTYSVGGKVKFEGVIYVCKSDGRWHPDGPGPLNIMPVTATLQ